MAGVIVTDPRATFMRKYVARINSRGQVTVPAELRRRLGLNPGDKVEFAVEDDGVTLQRPEFTLETVFRSVKPLPECPLSPPYDFDEMIRIAKEDRAERLMRQMRYEW